MNLVKIKPQVKVSPLDFLSLHASQEHANGIRHDQFSEKFDNSTASGSPSTGRSKQLSCSPSSIKSYALHFTDAAPSRSQHHLPCASCLLLFLQSALKVFSRGYTLPHLALRQKEQASLLSLLHQVISSPNEQLFTPLIYVYGAPGTGKTTTVMYALSLLDQSHPLKEHLSSLWTSSSCYINAGTLSTLEVFLYEFSKRLCCTIPKTHVEKIIKDLAINGLEQTLLSLLLFHHRHPPRSSRRRLCTNPTLSTSPTHRPLTKNTSQTDPQDHHTKKIIMVIDEIDHLNALQRRFKSCDPSLGKNHPHRTSISQQLCQALLSPQLKHRIVLIGISNASDSPTVGFSSTKNVHSLTFSPYTATELLDIVQHRLSLARNETLQELQPPCTHDVRCVLKQKEMASLLFSSSTLEIFVRKLSSQGGDCRHLLDHCRRVIITQMNQLEASFQKKTTPFDTLFSDTGSSPPHTPQDMQSPEKKCRTTSPQSATSSNDTASTRDSFHPLDALTTQIKNFSLADHSDIHALEHSQTKCLKFISSLPLQQQILMCAICHVAESSSNQHSPTPNTFNPPLSTHHIFETYKVLCESYHLPRVYQTVNQLYNDGLMGLNHSGLIQFSRLHPEERSKSSSCFPRGYSSTLRRSQSQKKITTPPSSTYIRLCFPESSLRASLCAEKQLFKTLLSHSFSV